MQRLRQLRRQTKRPPQSGWQRARPRQPGWGSMRVPLLPRAGYRYAARRLATVPLPRGARWQPPLPRPKARHQYPETRASTIAWPWVWPGQQTPLPPGVPLPLAWVRLPVPASQRAWARTKAARPASAHPAAAGLGRSGALQSFAAAPVPHPPRLEPAPGPACCRPARALEDQFPSSGSGVQTKSAVFAFCCPVATASPRGYWHRENAEPSGPVAGFHGPAKPRRRARSKFWAAQSAHWLPWPAARCSHPRPH